MQSAIFLLGLAAFTAGFGLIYPPLALIVGGGLLAVGTIAYERGES